MSLFSDIVFRLTQPYLLGQLLLFFRYKYSIVSFIGLYSYSFIYLSSIFSEDPQISNEQGLWCAGGFLTIIGLNAILNNQIVMSAFHNGMKIRVSICSIVYRKVRDFSIANDTQKNQYFFYIFIQ